MRTVTEGGGTTTIRRVPLAAAIAVVFSLLATFTLRADDSQIYWVSPTGTASWIVCQSATPLSGASACSMTTANKNATAGAIINLRGGTYNTNIAPVNSGTLANRITYQGYEGETATITNVGNIAGIHLAGVNYIRVLRVTVASVYQLAYLHSGSSYNEIGYSTLHTGTGTANTGINIFTLGAVAATANRHNWIHHNTIYGAGYVDPVTCEDVGGLMKIGASNEYDGLSDYNTVEDNTMYWGSHHLIEVDTRHNVIRNNFFHNEGWLPAPAACRLKTCTPDGLYGNRGITMLNDHEEVPEWSGSTFNLVENNRIGSAGLASDGNGADNLTLAGDKDIARYNTIYNAQELGLYFRESGSLGDNNRAYNNTVAFNGQGPQCRVDAYPGFWRGGARLPGGADDNVFKNNLLYGNKGTELHNAGVGNLVSNNWLTANGDPLFLNPSLADTRNATLPDLSLRAESGAIDNGTWLTVARGSGASSLTLTVDDALYFQDGKRGSALSNMQADWIAIGSVTNTVQIATIDYSTNRITLRSPKSWTDNAPIWLFRVSDGTTVLSGRAPDQGAHESSAISTIAKPQAPTRLRVVP